MNCWFTQLHLHSLKKSILLLGEKSVLIYKNLGALVIEVASLFYHKVV